MVSYGFLLHFPCFPLFFPFSSKSFSLYFHRWNAQGKNHRFQASIAKWRILGRWFFPQPSDPFSRRHGIFNSKLFRWWFRWWFSAATFRKFHPDVTLWKGDCHMEKNYSYLAIQLQKFCHSYGRRQLEIAFLQLAEHALKVGSAQVGG